MKKLAAVLATVSVAACAPVDFSKSMENARTHVVKEDYQEVYSRYFNYFTSCKMFGWNVSPMLLSNQRRGQITVKSAHEALYYVGIKEVATNTTEIRYNHGFVFGKEKNYRAMRAVGDGVMHCGEELPDSYR